DSDVDPSPDPMPSGAVSEVPSSTFGVHALDAPPFVPAALGTPDTTQTPPVAGKPTQVMPDMTQEKVEKAPIDTTSSSGQPERTELRLDDILPKEANTSSPEGLNDFFAILKQRPLPLDLEEDQRQLTAFNAAIAKVILDLYKKRSPPTVKLLQSKLRESQQFSEEHIQSVLLVCARDVPKIYQIVSSSKGQSAATRCRRVILLTKPPMWFQGFPPEELLQDEPPDQNANNMTMEGLHAGEKQALQPLAPSDSESLKVFHSLLWDESFLLPKQVVKAAAELKRKIPQYFQASVVELENVVKEALRRKWLRLTNEGLRPSNYGSNSSMNNNSRKPAPIGPLAPGAYPAQAAGGFQTAQREWQSGKHQASSETSDGQERTAYSQDASEEGHAKQDVSGFLTELMLLFPTGMRFAHLKEYLKTSNDGFFSENTFHCPSIASEFEGAATERANGGRWRN
ncbi:Ncapd2, partial [Symbiodinium pilosum]